MLHCMNLQPEPFEKIQTGQKTIELRLNDPKRRKIQPGDTIEFLNLGAPSEKIRVRVVAVHRFDSFEELYRTLPLTRCGYGPDDCPDPKDMDRYYSRKEQNRYGAVGIEITVLEKSGGEK